MIVRLKKWKCSKCNLEYWSIYNQVYLICPDCEIPCDITENIWKINEDPLAY